MKKFLVKKHCEATETCTVALSRSQDYYFGKSDGYLSRDFLPSNALITLYGYATPEEAECKLATILKAIPAEESTRYWKITAEIISVTVEK